MCLSPAEYQGFLLHGLITMSTPLFGEVGYCSGIVRLRPMEGGILNGPYLQHINCASSAVNVPWHMRGGKISPQHSRLALMVMTVHGDRAHFLSVARLWGSV